MATMLSVLVCAGASDAPSQQQRALGLDVSAWQGNISQTTWNNILNVENRQFVFLRSSRGGTTGYYNQSDASNSQGLNTLSQRYDDPYFVQNINRATTAGILSGSYHFSRPDIIETTLNSDGIANTGADEADHMIEMAGAWMRPGYLLPVHDLEAGLSQRSSSQLSQFCVDFSDRVYQVMGIRPLLYINQSYANYVNSTLPPVHPEFWIARYANQTDPDSIDVQNGHPPPSPSTANVYGKWNPNHTVANPYPDGHPWTIWQYASTVRLQSFNNGSSNLDGNVAHGGTEFIKDLLVPAVWMNDSSGQWTTQFNWNSGQTPVAPVTGPGQVAPIGIQTLPTPRLPTMNDTVVLDRPNADITVTLASGAQNIRKLYVRESLAITGGSLNINYVPSWDSTPISAQFSAPVTLGGAASVSVHTLQVDAARTFTVGGGSTLQFSGINLMPGSTPAKITLNGNVNFEALSNGTNTISNGSGAGNSGRIDLSGGNRTIGIAGGADLSVAVPIENGAITKNGIGTMRVTSANTYSGGTTVSGGKLFVNNTSGSGTGSGGVTVSGGILGGTGTISGATVVSSGGTVAPGTSIGTLTVGSSTWAGNGSYEWEIKDVSAGDGIGWDKLMVNGTLDVTATPASKFAIDVTSLTQSDARGQVYNFNNAQSYSWVIAEASGGILNFAPEKFQIVTANFDNSLGSGIFTITQSGNTIRLNFGPAGPPVIMTEPQSQSVALNSDATFSVAVSGAAPLFYQWRFEGTNVLLATASIYTRSNVQLSDAGGYSVVAWNALGSATSGVANLTVILPPSINSQPASITNNTGTTAIFSVDTSGTSPSHQWRMNGNVLNNGGNVSGATSPTLTLSSVSALDEAGYSVVVSNSAGSVTSAVATLTVAQPPTLLTQPQSQTRSAGENAAFSIVASGFQPMSFQWRWNGDPIAGATDSTYTRSSVQLSDAGNYSVVISNSVGTVTSSNGGLAVIPTEPYATITNIWNIRADSRAYVTAGHTERGIAINPFTGHVLLASRSAQVAGSLGIFILDGETGAELGAMNVAAINNTAFFKLSKIGVAEDGAIYAANMTTSSAVNDFFIYRWADESAAPTIAYSGKPDAGVTLRWGDSLAIRGGGTNTQIMVSGSGATTNIAVFTTSNGLSFQVAKLTASPAVNPGEFAQGLTFGTGDNFFSKHATHSSNVVKQFSLNLGANSATQTASAPMDDNVISMRLLTQQSLLCTVLDDNSTTNSGHQVRLYDVANFSSPVLVSNFFFLPIANGTNSPNLNRAGHVDTDGTRIVALDTQNGVVALKLIFGGPPTLSSHPANLLVKVGSNATFAVEAIGVGLHYQWLFGGNPILNATNSSFTILNVQSINAGNYSVEVSNAAGAVVSSNALLTVSTDQTAPTIAITYPASKQRLIEMVDVTNGVVVVRGTTSDNVGATRVEYQFNGGSWLTATEALNWSATVNMVPGENTITVRAFDAVNNASAPLSRTFTYVTYSLLSAEILGGGVLSPDLDNQSLENAKSYRMTALPLSVDWVFTNWTRISGGTTNVVSSNAVLNFLMESNLVLHANFITNPFVRAAGLYHGLFYSSNGVAHDSSGFFKIKVTAKLGYSAKLLLDGNAVSFSGKLSLPGTAAREVPRTKFGKGPLQVELIMDFADHLAGQVSASNWTAQLNGDRSVWSIDPGQQAVTFSNLYTMALPGLSNPVKGPPGASYGVVIVDRLGKVRLSGRAADQHPIRQSTKISKTGQWPFYVPMYVEKRAVNINGVNKTNREFQGSMLGWIDFATNQPAEKTTLAPLGDVSWIKTGWTNTIYAGGFSNVSASIGSWYAPPVSGVRVLNLIDGQLVMSEGNMGMVKNLITLKSNNTLTVRTTPLLSLKGGFSKTGQMQGVFAHPGLNHAPTKYFGVALPDYNYALGSFLGTNESGVVKLEP